ncbi:MAG: exo-alpha-sialidase [Victivallales bacterium]|nr:exo-alpha-sialidase [Victivallales bacterium]
MSLVIKSDRLICGDVCAWPNLRRFETGVLLAVFHNASSHALKPGGLDMMLSRDGGETWSSRRTIFPAGEEMTRCNHAVGTFGDTALVLCAGWRLCSQGVEQPRRVCQLAPLSVRLEENGDGWTCPEDACGLAPLPWVPFGNILQTDNGDLCTAAYLNLNGLAETFFVRSIDGGKSWKTISRIAEKCNETAVEFLGGGHWLAAVRTENRGLLQYDSLDDGKTWRYVQQLTLRRQVTGNLLRLSDGRLMLCYGNRNQGHFGVDMRVSEDNGAEWGEPMQLAATPSSDCGYPSTVELAPNEYLTLYYTQNASQTSYELRQVRWFMQ